MWDTYRIDLGVFVIVLFFCLGIERLERIVELIAIGFTKFLEEDGRLMAIR